MRGFKMFSLNKIISNPITWTCPVEVIDAEKYKAEKAMLLKLITDLANECLESDVDGNFTGGNLAHRVNNVLGLK